MEHNRQGPLLEAAVAMLEYVTVDGILPTLVNGIRDPPVATIMSERELVAIVIWHQAGCTVVLVTWVESIAHTIVHVALTSAIAAVTVDVMEEIVSAMVVTVSARRS